MQNIQPIAAKQRTAIVDMLRGWALLGVVLMNYNDYYFIGRNFTHFKPDTLTNVLPYTGSFIFAAKSWTLLSVLFGYGFAVLLGNVAAKGINPVRFFSWRMCCLFFIAFINCCFWLGDILKDYAFMGLVMLLFYRIKPKTAFIMAIILFLAVPALHPLVAKIKYTDPMKHYQALYHSDNIIDNMKFQLLGTWYQEVILPPYAITVHLIMLYCFFVGYAAQRIDFFNRLAENRKWIKRIFWTSLLFVILITGLSFLVQKYHWAFARYYPLRYPAVIATMLLIASGLCWLYINNKLKAFFGSMELIGRMTLTNYMVQNIIAFFVFAGCGLGLNSSMPYYFYMLLALSIYVVQVFFSKWWLSRYNYGLVEWLWRQLSYWKRLPLKKSNT